MTSNSFKRYSEQAFAEYIDQLGLFWDYERNWGVKRPDFTIYSDSKRTKVIAVVEIEDIDYPIEERKLLESGKMLVKSTDPYSKIREKINVAREQLRYAKDYPCFLIINDNSGPVLPPFITLGAMLGDVAISVPVWQDKKPPVGKQHSFFGEGGKMIDPKHKRLQNTTITAIGFIGNIKPDEVKSGFDKELKKLAENLDVKDNKQVKDYFKKARKLRRDFTKLGYNLDLLKPTVNFVVNPIARKSFPKKHFMKPYTYINSYSLKTGIIKMIYSWHK